MVFPCTMRILILMLLIQSTTDAVILTGSSAYAVPGINFTLTCDVPDEANHVQLYRRPSVTTILGSIQVAGSQCYNTALTIPVLCSPDVCSCTATSGDRGTVFRWVIHPQTRDNGSVWFCRRTNPSLPEHADRIVDSRDYTLLVQTAQTMSLSVTPPSPVVGQEVTLTCTASQDIGSTSVFYRRNTFNVVEFAVNNTSCTPIPQGAFNYTFTCGSSPLRQVSLTIPAAYVTEDEHGSNWTCEIFLGAVSNTVHLTLSGATHTDPSTTINPADRTPIDGPASPTHVSADCKGYGSAEVSWRAGNNGGNKQTFRVLYKTDGATKAYPKTITEHGNEDYVMTLDNLKENTLHMFTVFAFNSVGNVTSTETGKCTVHERLSPTNNTAMFNAGVAMLAIGIIAVILTVATIVVFIKRKHTCLSGKETEHPHHLGNMNNADSPVDQQQNSRAFESLHGRSQPNTYEDLGSTDTAQRQSCDYINTSDANYINT